MTARTSIRGTPLKELPEYSPGDDPLARPPMGPLRLDLLVECLEASLVKGPDDKAVPAYETTFKAVLPETVAAVLLAHVQDQRVSVRILRPDEDDEEVLDG